MEILKTAAVLTATLATASAQTTTIQYQGRVVDVVDDLGILDGISPGLAASGSALVDLEAEDLVIDIAGAKNIGAFPILGLDTTVLDQTYNSSQAAALILDDVFSNDTGSGAFDFLFFGGSVDSSAFDDSYLGFDFRGNNALFSDSGVDNVTLLKLENLEVAEVTIEFRDIADDNSFATSRVTIEVLSITVNGVGRGVTLSCLADTNQNGVVDVGDFSAWISLFNTLDYRADINLDGQVTPSDFSAWVGAYNRGC